MPGFVSLARHSWKYVQKQYAPEPTSEPDMPDMQDYVLYNTECKLMEFIHYGPSLSLQYVYCICPHQ